MKRTLIEMKVAWAREVLETEERRRAASRQRDVGRAWEVLQEEERERAARKQRAVEEDKARTAWKIPRRSPVELEDAWAWGVLEEEKRERAARRQRAVTA